VLHARTGDFLLPIATRRPDWAALRAAFVIIERARAFLERPALTSPPLRKNGKRRRGFREPRGSTAWTAEWSQKRFQVFTFHFGCIFEVPGLSAYLNPSMSLLRTIILILAMLVQALPAQALWPLFMGKSAVCEMACCAALSDEELDACECSAGGESPALEVPALPPKTPESAQMAAALAAGGNVLWRRPEKRIDEAQSASMTRWGPHLPKVRLAVLFCSFLI
jgi:hypothetical protein